jgi:hypothetical protein
VDCTSPAQAAQEQSVVEREADHRRRHPADAVQLVEAPGREQRLRGRLVIEGSRGGDHALTADEVDFGQRRKRIDQRIAGEEGAVRCLVRNDWTRRRGKKLPSASL